MPDTIHSLYCPGEMGHCPICEEGREILDPDDLEQYIIVPRRSGKAFVEKIWQERLDRKVR